MMQAHKMFSELEPSLKQIVGEAIVSNVLSRSARMHY